MTEAFPRASGPPPARSPRCRMDLTPSRGSAAGSALQAVLGDADVDAVQTGGEPGALLPCELPGLEAHDDPPGLVGLPGELARGGHGVVPVGEPVHGERVG